MKRAALAIGAGVCVIAVVAATIGQTPIYTAPEIPRLSPAVPSLAPAQSTGGYSASPTQTAFRAPAASTTEDDGPAVSWWLQKWASASESDKAKTEQGLRDALNQRFQASLTSDETEIRRLDAELQQRREKLALLRRKQDEIIDVHLQGLLLQAEGIRWPCGFVYSIPNSNYVPVIDGSGVIGRASRPTEASPPSATPVAPYVLPPTTLAPSPPVDSSPHSVPSLAPAPSVFPAPTLAPTPSVLPALTLAPAPPAEPSPPPATPDPATKSVVRPAAVAPAAAAPSANSPLFKNLKPVRE